MERGEFGMHYAITRILGTFIGAALMLGSVTFGAQAVTYNRSDIIDLDSDGSIVDGEWIGLSAVSFAPVTLDIGDVLVLSISFANSKALEMSNIGIIDQEGVLFASGTGTGNMVETSSATNFNLLAGSLTANPITGDNTCTNCFATGTNSANLTDTSFTFDQVTFTTTLLSLPASFGGSITLSGGNFYALHGDTRVVDLNAPFSQPNLLPSPSYLFAPGGGFCPTCVTPSLLGAGPTVVPLPTPLILFLTGLIGLGLTARRGNKTLR